MSQVARRIRWEGGWLGAGPLSCINLQRTVTAGSNSVIEALRAIDARNPPKTVRKAYERLAFPLGGGVTRLPAGPVSLREAARRIRGAEAVKLEFLSLNTYLLPGLQIPFGKWIDDVQGWDALAWFGIPFGGALLMRLGLASLPGVAIGAILKAADFTPSKVVKELAGIDLDRVVSFNPKPALAQRARLLGATLGTYDAGCLCEVFTDETREQIAGRLEENSGGRSFAMTAGPDDSGEWTFAGSGLLFVAARNRPIVRTERIVFAERGNKRKDSDAWANKGVLLNVIDLGFGRLELFQTHLYYGGGLRDSLAFPGIEDPTLEERMNVWRTQLAELATFYRRHHDPQNVAVITGDLNMGGGDVHQYREIRRVMDGLNMRDLWTWDVYGRRPSEGSTCRLTDGDAANWHRDFGLVCQPLEQRDRRLPRSQYCDDRILHHKPPAGAGRYDYIFAENPTSAHRYHLEVSRIVRRPFPLGREVEAEKYVSDHLGLELTMYCSPRR